ncbi:hypothetical protein, partial [Virgibacillus kimchii]
TSSPGYPGDDVCSPTNSVEYPIKIYTYFLTEPSFQLVLVLYGYKLYLPFVQNVDYLDKQQFIVQE